MTVTFEEVSYRKTQRADNVGNAYDFFESLVIGSFRCNNRHYDQIEVRPVWIDVIRASDGVDLCLIIDRGADVVASLEDSNQDLKSQVAPDSIDLSTKIRSLILGFPL